MHVSTGSPGGAADAAGAADADDIVDQALDASRALVDIAARSLVGIADTMTLPQYRVLVLVDGGGTTRVVDLSRALGIHASTSSRLVDRLVARKLVARHTDPDDRRSSALSITAEGHRLVARVNARRREEIQKLFEHLRPEEASVVLSGLRLFSDAATASGHGTPRKGAEDSADDGGSR